MAYTPIKKVRFLWAFLLYNFFYLGHPPTRYPIPYQSKLRDTFSILS